MLVVMPNQTYVDFLVRDLPHRVDLPHTKGSQMDVEFMLNQRCVDTIEIGPVLSSLAVLAISMPKDAFILWNSLFEQLMRGNMDPLRLLNLVRFSRAVDVFGIKKIELPGKFKSLLVLARMPQYYDHKMRPQVREWRKRSTRKILDCRSDETGQSLATILIALLRQGDLLFVQEQ